MAILRNRLRNRFTSIPNSLITDPRISAGAFRVAAYLFSRPDGWNVRRDPLKEALGIADNATVANYFSEIQAAGWIARTRSRDAAGRLTGGYDYELLSGEEPAADLTREKPYVGKNPTSGKTLRREKSYVGKNPTHSNTEGISNTELSEAQKAPNREIEAENPGPKPKAEGDAGKRKKVPRKKEKTPTKRFVPPAAEEVAAIFRDRGAPPDLAVAESEKFVDFYASKDWKVGRVKMKSYPAAARNWIRRTLEDRSRRKKTGPYFDIGPDTRQKTYE